MRFIQLSKTAKNINVIYKGLSLKTYQLVLFYQRKIYSYYFIQK
jgi:hypothetical protein